MGSEIFTQENEMLKFSIEINGTDQIAFVEIARLQFDKGEWENIFYKRIVERNLFHEGKFSKSYDYSDSFDGKFEGDAVYYLRMAQQKTVDDYPAFAWSSPIWITKRSL